MVVSPWRKIGSWHQSNFHTSNGFEYRGYIPHWVREQTPRLLGHLFHMHHTKEGCPAVYGYGRRTRVLSGRHYAYKITFRENDESNDGEVYRRPLGNPPRIEKG